VTQRLEQNILVFFNIQKIISKMMIPADNNDIIELVDKFQNEYLKHFKDHGYGIISEARIRHYYKLFFITKHNLGLKFWNIATEKTLEEAECNQKLLF